MSSNLRLGGESAPKGVQKGFGEVAGSLLQTYPNWPIWGPVGDREDCSSYIHLPVGILCVQESGVDRGHRESHAESKRFIGQPVIPDSCTWAGHLCDQVVFILNAVQCAVQCILYPVQSTMTLHNVHLYQAI